MNQVLLIGKHISRYSSALHTHKNYKLIYCSAGSGRIQFEHLAYPYHQGDLVVIEPGVLHVNVTQPGFSALYLTLDQLPFKVKQVLIVHDTSTQPIAQCFSQMDYYYPFEFFNKSSVMESYATLLSNIISALTAQLKVSPLAERLKDCINNNFADAAFEVNAAFAQEQDYNANYLKKLFKKEVGTSPQQYLINLRLSHAIKLLSTHKPDAPLSITQIAYACGYDDPLYFSRSFKTRYGSSPKAFYQDSHC